MTKDSLKIGVVAPASRMEPDVAEQVKALAATNYPDNPPVIQFHPQCFLSSGHFAGDDRARAQAFLDIANDDSFSALWFGRGGYGSGRLLELAIPRLTPAARRKTYMGYSDAGAFLGALYAAGCTRVVHGPMPQDIRRTGGEAAVLRALGWLVRGDTGALEPSLSDGAPAVAFNATILGSLIGTPWQPDLAGHVLMLEEVSEHMYRIDRSLFHITSNPSIREVAGLRLGRCSDIPPNDPDFGQTEEEVARYWCERSGIAWLGRADIGHDAANKVVPFGPLSGSLSAD